MRILKIDKEQELKEKLNFKTLRRQIKLKSIKKDHNESMILVVFSDT